MGVWGRIKGCTVLSHLCGTPSLPSAHRLARPTLPTSVAIPAHKICTPSRIRIRNRNRSTLHLHILPQPPLTLTPSTPLAIIHPCPWTSRIVSSRSDFNSIRFSSRRRPPPIYRQLYDFFFLSLVSFKSSVFFLSYHRQSPIIT